MTSVSDTMALSVNRKASGRLPSIPYDPILYGDALAKSLNEEASLNETSRVREEDLNISIGASGDFNGVVDSMPLEMLIETRVYGPAHSETLRQTNALFCDKSRDDDGKYCSREIEANLIRDEICFMSILEEGTREPKSHERQVRRAKTLVGNVFDETQVFDDGHLPVREQLCDRLVHVESDGSILKQIYSKETLTCFPYDNNDDAELDPTINAALKDALETFADRYRDACAEQTRMETKDSKTKQWVNSGRRHKMMIASLPQRIKKKWHAFTATGYQNEHSSEEPILDSHHPNKILWRGIDELHANIIQEALKEGADIDNVFDGRSPFCSVFARMCRIDSGHEPRCNTCEHEKIADMLRSWGCEINSIDCDNLWNGWAPIHYAACYGNLNRMEWLIRCGASIHTKTTEGHTPLMLACEEGKFLQVYTLVKNGANFREKDSKERTVLHYAAASGNINIIKFLVQCGCAFDKRHQCHKGETPLSISARVNGECRDYLSKATVPKLIASPYIDKILGSHIHSSLISNGINRGVKLMRNRGIRRKRQYHQGKKRMP